MGKSQLLREIMKPISFLWKVFYILFMLVCLMALIIYYVFGIFMTHRMKRGFVYMIVRFWARTTVLSTGSTVEITGLENIPQDHRICLIGNHQSLFDIPSLLGWMGISAGFIAKQELKKVPIISQWMQLLPSVFINRSSAREAIKSFQESVRIIQAGNPIVIFPEGTRAKSDNMAEFKAGSFKLATMAEATILPFAVSGTWRIFEIDGSIHSRKVKISILPPITPNDAIYHDKAGLPVYLHDLVQKEQLRLLTSGS